MTVLLRILGVRRFQAINTAIIRSVIQQRTMSEHLERTAHNFRQPGVSEAVVTSIQDVSPSVKQLTLQVNNPHFSFKAGQWVDFFIPGIEVFTGFSMCSAPHKLKQHGILELAVQVTDYPPTLWVHEKCKVGDKVGIRVGGDQIIYDPQPGDPKTDILLLAGGIGINPLVSIIQHVAHLHDNKVCDTGKVQMLYSASSIKELIFKQTIADICQRIPDVNCQFFVTKENIDEQDQSTSNSIISHRIDGSTLEGALKNLDITSVRCYICGPPPMIASMETYLQELGVKKEQFHCEKWW
ncbi:oxidoreductase NAD-binding domain-containing protein 1-like isoform X2 [Amphiura filiformis]|uniref:oxidoreductase NAD-binding domain-containing protein 1-like isoform X2 n=1 Tax=Amphiura filiformis TaxID=82378 RepID=UPI003B21C72B